MRSCWKCKQPKTNEDFYPSSGKRRVTCKDCEREYSRKYMEQKRELLRNWKKVKELSPE